MSEAKVVFILDGTELVIQCTPEDKIRDICQKYTAKIETNMNSLLFLYGGIKLNMDLKSKSKLIHLIEVTM